MVQFSTSLKSSSTRLMRAWTLLLLTQTVFSSASFAADLKASAPSKSDATATLKMEKPLVDSSTPQAPKANNTQDAGQRQSSSGYFIPTDVVNSGAPPQHEAPPSFPSENSIPAFGKPLPTMPADENVPPQAGQGWTSGQPSSGDEERVARLEKSVLGSTYPEHDVEDRVEHLEEELFKAKGSGPMDVRIKKMETSVFGQSAAFGGGAPPLPPAQMSMNAPNQITGTQTPSHAPYEMAPYPATNSSPNIGPGFNGASGSGAPNSGAPNIYGTSGGYGTPNSAATPGNYGRPNIYGAQPPVGGAQAGSRPVYSGFPNLPNAGSGQPVMLNQAAPYPNKQSGGYQSPQYGSGMNGGGYPNQNMPPRSGVGFSTPINTARPNYPVNAPGYPGGAPYAPPGGQLPYGVPQQPYVNRPVNSGPSTQFRPPLGINPSGYPNGSPGGPVPSRYVPDADSQKVIGGIQSNPAVGDFYQSIRKFQVANVARWQHFPVLIHLPLNSPELWRKNLNEDVKKWSMYVPLKTAADYESFVIDVKWENKLPPGVFGITRVEGSGAGLKVIIFLLRPTFYPTDVPESTLQAVFLHELGHGIGLLGHSTDKNDVMYCDEKLVKKVAPSINTISQRDLNTLKRVYCTAPIGDSFLIQPPLEYTSR